MYNYDLYTVQSYEKANVQMHYKRDRKAEKEINIFMIVTSMNYHLFLRLLYKLKFI